MAPNGLEVEEGPFAVVADDSTLAGRMENGGAGYPTKPAMGPESVVDNKTDAARAKVIPTPVDGWLPLEGLNRKASLTIDTNRTGGAPWFEGSSRQPGDVPPRKPSSCRRKGKVSELRRSHSCVDASQMRVAQLPVQAQSRASQSRRVPRVPDWPPPSISGDSKTALTQPLLGDFVDSSNNVVWKSIPEHTPALQLLPGRCSPTPRHTQQEGPPGNRSESLDYEPIQNAVFLNNLRKKDKDKEKRHIYGYSGRTLAKFLITLQSGVVIGLIAIALSSTSKHLIFWKNNVVMTLCDLTSNQGFFAAMFFHMMYSVGLVVFAVSLVQFWAPEAAGAGVSLVIAYLNGNHVPNLFHLRTLFTKIIGTMCALSANLFLGPEGPMVHVGAAVASALTYMECMGCCMLRRVKPAKLYISAEPGMRGSEGGGLLTTNHDMAETGYFRRKLSQFCDFIMELHSDLDRRDFLSAGAGAGIAAAFGAPIGGVLFSMEEAATYWSKKVAWRCFLCAVAAVMTLNWVHPLLGPDCKDEDDSIACDTDKTGMLSFEKGVKLENGDWLRQTPAILVISVITGLLGMGFNMLRVFLWRYRAAPKKHTYRILEGIIVAVVTVAVMFIVSSLLGSCRTVLDKSWEEESAFLQFNCAEGKHNDLASAFMAPPEVTIKRLFSLGSVQEESSMDSTTQNTVKFFDSHFTIQSFFVFIPFYFAVMSLGAGIAIPGGLFLPAIMVGGATGALYGRLMHRFTAHFLGYHKIQPGFYALLGATGSLASVFRSSISLVVIVIEGTRDIDYLFGVVLAVVVSNWVAHHVVPDGIYESEIERAGNVYVLKPTAPRALLHQTTEDVMASDVHTFRTIEKVSYVLKVLRDTTCNGFPVIAQDERDSHGDMRVGRLEGLILRSQLLVMLRKRVFCDRHGNPKTKVDEEEIDKEMRHFYRIHHTHQRFLATTEQMVDDLELDWVHTLLSPKCTEDKLEEEQGMMALGLDRQISTRTKGGNCPSSLGHRSLQGASLLAGTMYMDLRPYMNRAPLTVRQETSAARTYEVFVSLGLRHLCVVNEHNEVVGVVTRKDLDHASGHGYWRTTKIAPSPEQHRILYRNVPSTTAESIRNLVWQPSGAGDRSPSHSAEPFIGYDDDSSEDDYPRPNPAMWDPEARRNLA